MAKKSASRRHSAARRPQGASKQPTLVRTPEASASSVATAEAEASVATMTEAAPAAAQASSTAAKPAAKPQAQSKAVAPRSAPKSTATRADASRVARAQATKSARSAHLISASNYGYVIHDLRLTGILAAIMLIGMIVLKLFVLR
ncbi:MAG TPA: hypothetical protein VH393_03420 [Ktedonobacterales bacterium]|jgi:hypothetical protein